MVALTTVARLDGPPKTADQTSARDHIDAGICEPAHLEQRVESDELTAGEKIAERRQAAITIEIDDQLVVVTPDLHEVGPVFTAGEEADSLQVEPDNTVSERRGNRRREADLALKVKDFPASPCRAIGIYCITS